MTPWTVAHQAPPSMGFSRQEYWSGVPLPSLLLDDRHILTTYSTFSYRNIIMRLLTPKVYDPGAIPFLKRKGAKEAQGAQSAMAGKQEPESQLSRQTQSRWLPRVGVENQQGLSASSRWSQVLNFN